MLLGLAVVLALMLVLLLLAAIGFGPERPRSLGPIPAPPHFEASVGGSQALAPRLASVAQGVAAPVTRLSSAQSRAARTGGEDAGAALAVAPAQAVDAVGAGPPGANHPAPEAQPVPAPVAQPAPAPVATTAPSPSGAGTESSEAGGGGGPIAAGVTPPAEEGEEVGACEGTEYTVTVAFDVEAIFGGAEDATITLRRVGSDGSETELQAEGGLDDLNALLEQFAAEGECVTVVVEPLSGEDDTGAEVEAPEAESVAVESPPVEAEPEPAAP